MRSLSPLSRRILKKPVSPPLFSAPLSFLALFCPTLPAVRSERQPQFFSLLRRRHLFLPFRCPSSPLLPKLGLSFPEKGRLPRNATSEELAAYNAWFAASPEENIIYLTFDCGYENGNTPAILDALQKHQHPRLSLSSAIFSPTSRILSNAWRQKAISSETTPGRTRICPNFHAGSLLRRAEPCFRSLPGDHQPGNGEIYRPPQGKYSTQNLQMAKDLGYQTFFWSLAYVDWYQDQQPTHEEAFKKLTGRIHPVPSSCFIIPHPPTRRFSMSC